jgi:redox-sensitive bicupin YhaK (pirin superfamily)
MGNDFTVKDGFRMYHGQTKPGFPAHPHRGFETITVVRKGLVDHADSAGGAGRYGNGDVQWMTAGKGLQHSEMFPLLKQDEENPFELFQIWINLPAVNKFVEPTFKMLWSEEQAKEEFIDSNGKKTNIEVVAGKINKNTPTPPPNSWAQNPDNHVAIWNIKIEANGEFKLPKAVVGLNRNLYFYKGEELQIEDKKIDVYKGIKLESDQDVVIQNGNTEARLVLLQGKPIGERVVR